MWFMIILSWLAIFVQVSFIIMSLAAGLYYLTELVEEYTVIAAKVIRYVIFVTLFIYLCLLIFENLPMSLLLTGIISQLVHLVILKNFPFFTFTSIPFISGIILLFVNHYLAFTFFANGLYPLTQVLGFFTLCLWIVPFSFFISLSANDNVLPTLAETRPLVSDDSDVVSHYFSRKTKKYGLYSFLNYCKENLLGSRVKKSF
ncbi:protein TEX261 [Tetranychus urticae]|uniref:Protein TEX261 n=1 Tax=Tetranychus urticae TaxID=32264 RepID=T1KNE6_TETUR|nr:protein TEX261 [Tetranychus urticae]